jgi:hypothetical protein
MSKIDRAGKFKAIPTQCSLVNAASGAVMWKVNFKATEYWGDGGWENWTDFDQSIFADQCVVKKDGSPNERVCKTLMDTCGWNGYDFAYLQGDLSHCTFLITVEPEEYNGQTQLKVKWIDNPEAPGGGKQLAPLDTNDIKVLQAKHNAKMRAFAQANKSAAPKPPVKAGAPY